MPPIERIRAIDFAKFRSRPYVASLLAELGTEVTRIENARQPRGGGRGLRAQRLPNRPDLEDCGCGILHRHRHLRRDPALCQREGLQGHSRDQQAAQEEALSCNMT